MDHDIFSPIKIMIAQVGVGIAGGIATINTIGSIWSIIIPLGTFIGLAITWAYTIYKWMWSSKFNNMDLEIKKETLKQLKQRA